MPDPRWPLAELLLAYFICAIDWADAEFENIAVQPQTPPVSYRQLSSNALFINVQVSFFYMQTNFTKRK